MGHRIKQIGLFCGSNMGNNERFGLVAAEIGTKLAQQNIGLVYGGANVGLMRMAAEASIKNGGKVTGVITHFLAQKHLTQQGLFELITVDTMPQRKTKMAELSDAFLILPGGFGTMEEVFEVLTASQLGFHAKPVVFLNLDGFYNFLKMQIETMVTHNLMLPQHAALAHFSQTIDEALAYMEQFSPPVVEKWIERIVEENSRTR